MVAFAAMDAYRAVVDKRDQRVFLPKPLPEESLRRSGRKALIGASLVMLLAPLANFVLVLLVGAGVMSFHLPSLRMPASVIFIALVWFATRENGT